MKSKLYWEVAEVFIILTAVWLCTGFVLYDLPNSARVVPAAALLSVLWIVAMRFPEASRNMADFCFRYRWILALLVFGICVGLRLHGSSIGVYDEFFPTQITEKESTLFGIPRRLRSDEYGVTTPLFFSQASNKYRLYSHQMSLSPTNMVLDYYSPVWDWTILGKPLSWGFLLLGNEIGLSWYWCGEIILIFMTAFEMCRILTEDKRRESFLGAFMIGFSPAIQWWVMPHMPPVILYAMALFCVGYWFFTAKGLLAKWSSAALAVMSVLGFALSIFPSFQVPCGYIVLILLVVCLRRDREKIRFSLGDWPRLILPFIAVFLILGRFFLMSRSDLSLLMNTVYPGRRMSLGGDRGIYDLFTNVSSLFLSYKDITYLNNCEVASYIHFAPFFVTLFPILFFTLKKREKKQLLVGSALFWILLGQIVFMIIGIPKWMGEVTLLRFCNRMHEVYGWVATLFTIWGFSVLARQPDCLNIREKLLWPLAYGILWLVLINDELRRYFSQFFFSRFEIGDLLAVFAGIVCTSILYLTVFQKHRLMSALMILMMLFCGATVNPVERGIGAVINHPVSAAISEIAEQEPASHWLCLDRPIILSNYVMANGAKVLNATNFYPDREKWELLDPENQYEDQTNRYANESAELTDKETSVELVSPDHIRLHLNPQSLKELKIRYLFTPVDYSDLLAEYGISSEYVTGQDGYAIYSLDYEK